MSSGILLAVSADGDVQVRPATDFDHAAIRALSRELTAGMPPWRPVEGAAAAAAVWVADACRAAGDPGHALLVACDGEGLVLGFAGVTTRRHFSGDREAYLGELVVDPHARRRGVATRLVAGAEQWARRQGLTRLTLDTGWGNRPARELYARLGYAEEQVVLTRALG